MEKKKISLEEILNLPISSYRFIVTNYNFQPFQKTTYDTVLLVYDTKLSISKKFIVKRRYSEFKILYDDIIKNYPNINLPEFPKKLQIIEKKRSRVEYFKNFFKTLYLKVKENEETKNNIINKLYNFMFYKNEYEIYQLSKEEIIKYFQIKESNLNEEKKENGFKEEKEEKNKEKIILKNPIKKEMSKEEKEELIKTKVWDDILVKTYKKKYKLKTIKIENQCLMIYNNKTQITDFNFLVPLYKMNIELYRVIKPNTNKNPLNTSITKLISPKEIELLYEKYPNVEIGFLDSEIELKLQHDYDNSDLYLKFTSNFTIAKIYTFIKILETNSYSRKSECEYISEINETNSNIYGKLIIKLLKLKIPKGNKNTFKIKLNLYPYTFPTKKFVYDENLDIKEYIINQKFGIPLHNRFISLKISVYLLTSKLLSKTEYEELIGEYSINLPELLNNFSNTNNTIIGELNPISDKDKDKEKVKGFNIVFKYKNLSSLLALVIKNSNKNIIENYPLGNGLEGPYKISTLFKRIKRVFIIISSITETIKSIINFKYPIFSLFFLLLEIYYFLFFDTRYLLSHILIILIILFFCFSKTYQSYFSKYINCIFFTYKNPYDKSCQYVKSQTDFQKEKQNDYLVVNERPKFKIPTLKSLNDIKKSYSEIVFKLSKILTNIEKAKNLFLWTDPILSFYFFLLMIGLIMLYYNIQFRFILMFAITKKFIKGIFYYKIKYKNNKEVAIIILKNAYLFYINQTKKRSEKDNVRFLKLTFNEKLQKIILNSFKIHAEIEIKEDIFKKVLNMGEFIEEIGNCEDLLYISKNSELYHYTINDYDIYHKTIQIENILMYYIQNIKSDYYLACNELNDSEDEDEDDDEDDYFELNKNINN